MPTYIRPWANAPEAWARLNGKRLQKQLAAKVRGTNLMQLNGRKISDKNGKEYTLKVRRKPLDSYAETNLEGMQTKSRTFHKVTALDNGKPVATVGIVKVGGDRVRGISGEVEKSYAGTGIFSKLCDAAWSPFPKGTTFEGGIGSIESLVSVLDSFAMRRYLLGLPKSKQERIGKISQRVGDLRARVGRVDFGHNPGDRATKNRISYREWQLLSGTVVDGLNSGVKLEPEALEGVLLARAFKSNFRDFKLGGGRFRYRGTREKIALPIMTAVKWRG